MYSSRRAKAPQTCSNKTNSNSCLKSEVSQCQYHEQWEKSELTWNIKIFHKFFSRHAERFRVKNSDWLFSTGLVLVCRSGKFSCEWYAKDGQGFGRQSNIPPRRTHELKQTTSLVTTSRQVTVNRHLVLRVTKIAEGGLSSWKEWSDFNGPVYETSTHLKCLYNSSIANFKMSASNMKIKSRKQ